MTRSTPRFSFLWLLLAICAFVSGCATQDPPFPNGIVYADLNNGKTTEIFRADNFKDVKYTASTGELSFIANGATGNKLEFYTFQGATSGATITFRGGDTVLTNVGLTYTNGAAVLNWQVKRNTNIIGFEVEACRDTFFSTTTNTAVMLGAANAVYTFTEPDLRGVKYYRIHIINDNGPDGYSAKLTTGSPIVYVDASGKKFLCTGGQWHVSSVDEGAKTVSGSFQCDARLATLPTLQILQIRNGAFDKVKYQ